MFLIIERINKFKSQQQKEDEIYVSSTVEVINKLKQWREEQLANYQSEDSEKEQETKRTTLKM